MSAAKIFVITDAAGKIIGSYQPPVKLPTGAPSFRPAAHPTAGHKVHELDLPENMQNIASAEELHRQLAELLRAKRY